MKCCTKYKRNEGFCYASDTTPGMATIGFHFGQKEIYSYSSSYLNNIIGQFHSQNNTYDRYIYCCMVVV